MSASAVVKEAASRGVRISLNGDKLKLAADAKPPEVLLAKLKQHKAEIVALLRQEAALAIEESPQPDEVEIVERKAIAMDGVPVPYLDGWARLQCQRPAGVPEDVWRQAINDGGRFLDRWGSRANELGWTPGDLFDVPCDGKEGGLVWELAGKAVIRLDKEFAVLEGQAQAK